MRWKIEQLIAHILDFKRMQRIFERKIDRVLSNLKIIFIDLILNKLHPKENCY
jgi:hypothetical protein